MKLIKVAIMNWVCNNVTTVYICYASIILYLYFAELSLYFMDQSLLFPMFSQIEHQIVDKKKKKMLS